LLLHQMIWLSISLQSASELLRQDLRCQMLARVGGENADHLSPAPVSSY
jgi:hypothetical protein